MPSFFFTHNHPSPTLPPTAITSTSTLLPFPFSFFFLLLPLSPFVTKNTLYHYLPFLTLFIITYPLSVKSTKLTFHWMIDGQYMHRTHETNPQEKRQQSRNSTRQDYCSDAERSRARTEKTRAQITNLSSDCPPIQERTKRERKPSDIEVEPSATATARAADGFSGSNYQIDILDYFGF